MSAQAVNIPSHASAVFLVLAGFFLWSCGDVAIRAMQALPMAVVVCFYAGSAVAVMSILSPWLGGFPETFRRPKLGLRMLRGGVLTGCNILAVIAFIKLDMATAYALIFLCPFMAKLAAFILLGEKPDIRAIALSLLAFAGVLIILRPGMVPLELGSLAALGLTVFFAFGYVMGRYIGEENQTQLSMILFQYSFVTIASLPFALPHLGSFDFGLREGALFALCGTTAVVGTICISTAFARAPASVVAPLHYSQMIWGILFGLAFFGEFPDGFTLLGACIIIGAGLALIALNSRKRNTAIL